ncbi:alpha/beta hydrolase [Kineosporia sp. J2-2]|uniref:Alpha/beta hydrolase n=1 Tax=Kineosporia corallincola TaxID=2835133 RepID=A0ABS5TQ97_9ACTN|nr:alpha/beta hydrolase [Kineosporia corallincola]MBT0773003.1 alpha/beta hydrolase [Kineosporia corallincola]
MPFDPSTIDLVPAAAGFAGPRPAVLVFPGGAYRFHAPHEGLGIAHWLASIGVHAFHFRYPFPSAVDWPGPLVAARQALDQVRAGGHGLAVGPVGVFGASAGGHLAGLLAAGAVLSLDEPGIRPPTPDFSILAYAVADLALLPDAPVAAMTNNRLHLRREFSPAAHITAATGPVFAWCALDDPPGLPNTLELARVCAASGVSCEVHVFPEGWHGLGLADGVSWGPAPEGERMPPLTAIPHTATWTGLCERWLYQVATVARK